jgi:hypothetical protein
MTWSPDLTSTGGAQAGLTSPTYTFVAAVAPSANSRKYVVTTLGGTQTNVRTHTAGDPFSLLLRNAPYRARPVQNPVTGEYGNVPLNRTEFVFEKGLKIDSAGSIRVGRIRITAELPAGSESNDAINIQALCSFAIGTLNEESSDIGESLTLGVF